MWSRLEERGDPDDSQWSVVVVEVEVEVDDGRRVGAWVYGLVSWKECLFLD